MIRSVLVICMGNVCRSPVGERLLARLLPNLRIHSAGLKAHEGRPPDGVMAVLARQDGIDLQDHRASVMTLKLAHQYDLILAMEKSHKALVMQHYPQVSGKTLLFNHWGTPKSIPDPSQKSDEYYAMIYQKLVEAAAPWKSILNG